MSSNRDNKGWQLREFEFAKQNSSNPLLRRLRAIWFNVAARWALADLIQQLNIHNQLLADQLTALEKSHAEAQHDKAELTVQVVQLTRELETLKATLAKADNLSSENQS